MRGVEAGHIPQMAGGEGVGAAGLAPAGVEEPVLVEAVRRQGGDGVTPLGQQGPEGVEIRRAGETAGRADDGDRLRHRRRAGILAGARAAGGGGAFHVGFHVVEDQGCAPPGP